LNALLTPPLEVICLGCGRGHLPSGCWWWRCLRCDLVLGLAFACAPTMKTGLEAWQDAVKTHECSVPVDRTLN
jgi:hypothetical protein